MRRAVAFVTGAGRGVGRAIALRLARDGYAVTVAGRSPAALDTTADAILQASGAALVVTCDVTDRAQVTAAVEQTTAAFGDIDVLVNNAGISASAPFTTMPDTLWDETIAVNLTGAYNCMRRIAPGMFARRRGRIINVASTAASTGYPYTAAYVASKHGLLGLTRAVALEARKFGVTVNAVCPGWIDSDMTTASIARIVERTGRSVDQARQTLAAMNNSGRLIAPDEVAAVCAHLASPAAAEVNGEAIDIQ